MSYTDEIFRVLEIEPTKDKRNIKRAYAAMAKKFHPEENPQEWQQLHDAYEAALAYANRGAANESQPLHVQQALHTTSEKEYNTKFEERERRQEPVLSGEDITQEIDEENRESQQVFASWQEERKERRKTESYWEAYHNVREALKRLKKSSIQSFRGWERIMLSPQMRLVRTEPLILKDMAEVLERSIIDQKTWEFLHYQLEDICSEISGGASRADEYDRQLIWDQLQQSMLKAIKRIEMIKFACILFFAFALFLAIFVFLLVIFGEDLHTVLAGVLPACMIVVIMIIICVLIDDSTKAH